MTTSPAPIVHSIFRAGIQLEPSQRCLLPPYEQPIADTMVVGGYHNCHIRDAVLGRFAR